MASDERRITTEEEAEIRRQLTELRQAHRALDAEIEVETAAVVVDTMQIQRLKKRKLALKDRIADLEDRLLPDIIA